jgi:ubiquinone/menaquinone biosynthesis C-methylase UbiE/broad specificity phosphatase PhoE
VRMLVVCQAEGLQNRYTDLLQDGRIIADGGLTAFGWEQTNLLSQWLVAHENVDAIYCAPLLRSRLTAQRLGQALNLPVTVHEGLPGRLAGELALPDAWASDVPTINQRPPAGALDALSPYGVYTQQLVDALDSIVQENLGKTVLVVLPGNGVATALRHFCGAHCLAVAVCHTGISELRRQEGHWFLMYVNRREHMPAPVMPAYRPKPEIAPAVNGDDHATDLATVNRTYSRLGLTLLDGSVKVPDREQSLRHLLKFAQLRPELSILDAGTGSGELAMVLAEEGAREVVGIDVSPVMLEAAEYLRLRSSSPNLGRVSFRMAPAHAMPFRDERFDAAVCRLVLHDSHRPQDVLAELARLLKHGGILILADLLGADDPVKRATQNAIETKRNPSHVAARSADQYRKLVSGAGFVLEGEQTVTFERELEEWLAEMQVEPATRITVREMIEAGLETDAAGLNARRRGEKIYFDQRLVYLKAKKP